VIFRSKIKFKGNTDVACHLVSLQQEDPLPQRARSRPSCLLVYFMTFLGRKSVDG